MKNKIFIQDWGILTNETIVCLGVGYLEIINWCKEKGIAYDFIQSRKDTIIDETTKCNRGFCILFEGQQSLLWLEATTKKWDLVETVAHETHHLVKYIADCKCFNEEKEFQAYLFVYLFRNILKKLGQLN